MSDQYPSGQQPYASQPYTTQPPASARTNTLAIVAFVLSFFVQVAAVICGHIALAQIKRTGEQGRGLAIAALVIGYIGIAFGVLIGVFYLVLIAGAVSSGALNS